MSGPTSFLTSDDLALMESHGEILNFAKNEIIIHEGSVAECLYLVREGIVQIDLSRLYGNDVLAYLGKDALFGEVSMMDHDASSANASAAQDCELLMITHSVMEELLAKDLGLASRFFRTVATTLAKRIRSTNTNQ